MQQARHQPSAPFMAPGLAVICALGLLLAVSPIPFPPAPGLVPVQAAPTFTISSPAFSQNGNMPARFTCEGENVSPPLEWSGVPARAKSLVLIVDDPDAPDPAAPRMVWDHWLVFNLPADSSGLTEGAARNNLPPGAMQGINSWKRADYGGPCPPIGRHRYFHKLYALDTMLENLNRPNKSTLEAAMRGHILGEAELIGTYQKSGS